MYFILLQVKRNGQTLHSQRIGETRLNTENHDEIVRLQNQIKIRTKLNCLQSDKVASYLCCYKLSMTGSFLLDADRRTGSTKRSHEWKRIALISYELKHVSVFVWSL